MKTINIIGSGNVAYHLIKKIQHSTHFKLMNVAVRSKEKNQEFITNDLMVTSIAALQPVDITIISVSDDAIEHVSEQITYTNSLVVHTSGTTNMQVLSNKNKKGVFYPLQTFSKQKQIDFTKVPLCLETESKDDMLLLKELANELSNNVYEISSEQRKSLHVSAVFVSNFVNHMYTIGNAICDENKVPFEILHPLIEETAQKIQYLSPKEAQTGPAIRRDEKTIKAHEAALTNETFKKIYQLITESIKNV
ncbi:DUF2520 domain-containing protein [Flavobacterium sp. xlx-214]|uniref:Rossmann-like and DUF2520 domain-containing protein n=1 Tax=unclassified Flavobacterium TaxID=196869 RepID=UPI0013D00BAC|nr:MULTISPECIES: Rossmann-like and DUF2520 domain-containing protein [unclassified Flavobacterium]MBA5793544.1 DUF2520 domain-containing protein [Flavobacterium sp. xlx-221]QMI82687.1 DUF2520 domain-containing protein [Flavobacterium sp. xlx-214]